MKWHEVGGASMKWHEVGGASMKWHEVGEASMSLQACRCHKTGPILIVELPL